MPIVWVDNVSEHGIVSDIAPHKLPIGAWSNGKNVEFRENQVVRMVGHQAVFGTPSIDPFFVMPWQDLTTYYWLYADANSIYRTDGTTHIDVTNILGAYSGGSHPRWNGGVLGGIPILNNNALVDFPQEWDSGTVKFINLTNWPATWQCKVIRTFGQFLVALFINESSVLRPTLVRWSDAAAVGSVPANWTPASSNDAGSFDLAETSDHLVDCLPLGNINVIYKEDSTWTQRFIGGNDVFAFKKTKINSGAISQNSMAEFKSKHFVVTKGDIIVHNTQVAESVVDSRMRRRIFNELDPLAGNYVQVVPNRAHNEIWVCIPTTGSGELYTTAYMWNWKNNTWSIRELDNLAWLTYGNIDSSSIPSTYDGSAGVTFDADSGAFDSRLYNPNENHVLLAKTGVSKGFFEAETTNQFDGNNYTSFVERTGLPLSGQDIRGNLILDHNTYKQCIAVYPQMTIDSGVVEIYVGAQDYVGSSIAWKGPYTFNPATQKKITTYISGRLLAVKIQSTSDHQWNLQRIGFDVTIVGQ